MEGRKFKVIKTIFMVIGPATMAMYLELAGPALPDFKHKLSATYEEIARVLVARSLGYFISALLGGALADLFPQNVDVFLSGAYFLGSLGTALIPWCETLWFMAVMFHLQGLGQGLIDTCNNSLCARMWGDKAATPLHALHFGFGMGALLAPILAGPFISDFSSDNQNLAANLSTYNLSATSEVTAINSSQNQTVLGCVNSTDCISPSYSGRIVIPYTISSILTFLVAVVFLGYFLCGRYTQRKSKSHDFVIDKTTGGHNAHEMLKKPLSATETTDKELNSKEDTFLHQNEQSTSDKSQETRLRKCLSIVSPGSCTNGDTSFGFKIFILIFIYYVNIVGGERAYGKYIYTFATESNAKFTKQKATLVNSLFWLCFTVGRAITIFLSKILKPSWLLIVQLLCNVLVGVVLCIWGYDFSIVLFISTALLGLTLSPIFPGGLAWANIYVRLTGVAMAIVFTGGACGGMIYQWLTGWLFDIYGSKSLSFVMLGYAVILSGTFLLMLLTAWKREPRFESQIKTIET